MIFLEISGVYTCPDCGAVHNLQGEFEGDTGCHDSGMEIGCSCGLVFEASFSFND